jgi:hypothetical protein
MSIDKIISFHIEKQFPAIYREQGHELVDFVKQYYKFLEENSTQSLYNGRRLFEYKDIDTTLERMLIFFKKKYLADLPFNDDTIRIIVKNILALYRRKGTPGGVELFFRLFYNESIKIYYPARDIFKPSDSQWKEGSFLQLAPNAGVFTSTKLSGEFSYNDIVNRTIIGAASRARATVDKINFIIINNSFTPIIFINDITGNFIGLENIICEINGVPVNFGIINGSLTSIDINFPGPGGNSLGDLVTFRATPDGIGATGIVTGITESTTGTIEYNLLDGGWGYSIDSGRLLVSDQLIFIDNASSNFTLLETLEDDSGNRGIVVAQTDILVAVKMEGNDRFTNNSIIETVDRNTIINIQSLSSFPIRVTPKNSTSPGPLYPDTANTSSVIIGELENIETVALIFDIIGDYANVHLDSTNYNDVPPALTPMSGNTDPVTIATTLQDAFNLETFDIGTIVRFENIDPGVNYVNDAYALPYDSRINLLQRKNQLVTLQTVPTSLNIGDEITQGSFRGKVLAVTDKTLTVRPYRYYGFDSSTPITFGGVSFPVIAVSYDFSSEDVAGRNAVMDTDTDFAVGRINRVNIIDSGYGYVHNTVADVLKNGELVSRGVISARGQGSTGGFWSTYNSHLSGYVSRNAGLEYYSPGKYIQDSNYYQEYSYEVQSRLDTPTYEQSLKEIVHVAGTKVFGRFNLEEVISTPTSSRIEIIRPDE